MTARIIGIGGVSRSGKSTLADKLKDELSVQTLVLGQDVFTRPISEIPMIGDRTDWEHPDSIDFDRLIQEIEENRNVNYIIVEGLLAFANRKLNVLYDFTLKLSISKETFIARRKRETRWGEEPDWYLEHVWECYLRYGNFEADMQLDHWNGEVPLELIQRLLNIG